MENNVYLYEKKAVLADKLSVYANWSTPFILDGTPRYPNIDFSQFQKVNSIYTTSLNREVQLDEYRNASGEVIYKAEKGPNGIFRLGKLSPNLSSCIAMCFVEASEQSEVSLHLICNLPCKFFLNGSFVAMDNNSLNQFVKCILNKGENTLVFECYRVSSDSEINIRLADLPTEEDDSMTALECGNCSESNRFLSVLYEGDIKSGVISYYAYFDDLVHQNSSLNINGEILDVDFQCIGEFEPCINKKSVIHLTDYPLQELEIPVINIRFTVSDDALLYETHRRFVLQDLSQINEAIFNNAEQTLKDPTLSAYDRYALRQCVQFAHDIGKDSAVIWTQTSFIRSLLFHLHNGLHMEDIYRLPEKHNIHFKNPLDGHDDMYMVVVPEGYTHERKYPLIINISNATRESLFDFYKENMEQGVIFADFYLKGITLGSYIGEAEFFTLFSDIKKRFNIDEDRVYLTGGCNGAYAVFSLAQNYPHLFAGIVAVAGGLYLLAIYNLLNIPVYNVFSNTDLLYTRSMRKQHEALKCLPCVQSVSMEACTHAMLIKCMQRKKVIEELLRHKRDQYPRNIRYYTERDCHNKCYWIELLGITFGAVYSMIDAHADSLSITITCENCKGLRIRIPPYVSRKSFQVHINGKLYRFSRYRRAYITFVLQDGEYILTDDKPYVPKLKGLGIIGVYRNSLVISCDKSNQTQMQVAKVLAHPRTMGFRTDITIAYPVRDYGYTPQRKQNLILLREYTRTTEYDDLLSAKSEHGGFTYQGNFREGSFVIMEAVEVSATNSVVLVITYHDEQLLSRFLFLREMILPGYCNGIHQLLNNRILVFDGRRCSSVYEPDASLKPIGRDRN